MSHIENEALLAKAYLKGDVAAVETLLPQVLAPLTETERSQYLQNGLSLAVHNNLLGIARYLLPLIDNQVQHSDNLINHCVENDNVDILELLLVSPKIKMDIHRNHDALFNFACRNNSLEVVKFLSSSPNLVAAGHTLVDVSQDNSSILHEACFKGNLTLAQYLLTSPEIKAAGMPHADLASKDNYAFYLACSNGHLQLAQYLMELSGNTINIHIDDDAAFTDACRKGHLPVVQYLQRIATQCINYHADDDRGFTGACLEDHFDVAEFLIFECNIEKTAKISAYLQERAQQPVLKMWAVRDFHDKMSNELDAPVIGKPKAKL